MKSHPFDFGVSSREMHASCVDDEKPSDWYSALFSDYTSVAVQK